MSCSNYLVFYSTFASSVLGLVSIIVVIAIYLWQQRDSEYKRLEGLEDNFKSLTKLINAFCEINFNARNLPPHPRLDLELNDLKKEVIERYHRWKRLDVESNSWKYIDEEYKPFLQAFISLQYKLYTYLTRKLAVVEKRSLEGNWIYIIESRKDFEQFMDRVYPHFEKAEGVLTFLGYIPEDHKRYYDKLYGNDESRKEEREFYIYYWTLLLDIKAKSKYIDDKIRKFEQKNMLSSITNSSQSMQFLRISGVLIGIFGIIIPFYMLQPNRLELLRCEIVFYLVLFFIFTSIICGCMSYRKRHRYGIKMIYRIIEDLRNHNDEFKRKRAAENLGNIGDEIAVKPLKEAIKRDNSEIVRLAAMGALVKLGKTKYLNQLITALKDEDGKVRSTALEILGDISDPKAVDPIGLLLEKEEIRPVRLSAIFALGKIDDSTAVKLLRYYADNDKFELVKKNANQLLIEKEF